MDANKLTVLRDVGYKIHKCCGLCVHGWFPKTDFGTCEKNKYEHQKHTGAPRQLSIHKYGYCPKFEVKPKHNLGTYEEFLK